MSVISKNAPSIFACASKCGIRLTSMMRRSPPGRMRGRIYSTFSPLSTRSTCGSMIRHASSPMIARVVLPMTESTVQPFASAYRLLANTQCMLRGSKYAIIAGTLSASVRSRFSCPRSRVLSGDAVFTDACSRPALQPGPRPAQPGAGPAFGPVLAADPPGVAELVHESEQVGIVDLAQVGLMALGHARDLDMADAGDVLAQLHREIALDDLAGIEIHLHLEVESADFRADGGRLVLAVEEKTRNVAGVDRLDHVGAAGRGRLSRRIVEIAHIGRAVERAVLARPDQAGHQVHALVAEHARILERARDAAPEFVFAAGQRSEAAPARVPIA